MMPLGKTTDIVFLAKTSMSLAKTSVAKMSALSEGLAHSTVHNHLKQLSVDLQSGALIFISELPGVLYLFTNKDFK